MTLIKRLLRLTGKLLSLAIDGVLFVISLWFAVGLIVFALVIVIALIYGIMSLLGND